MKNFKPYLFIGLIAFILLAAYLFSSGTLGFSFETKEVTADYGDSILVKSSSLHKAWKSSYKYALLLPEELSEEFYDTLSVYLRENEEGLTPDNTLILAKGGIDLLLGNAVGAYSVVRFNTLPKVDSTRITPVLLASIERLPAGTNREGYAYKMTRRDTVMKDTLRGLEPGKAIYMGSCNMGSKMIYEYKVYNGDRALLQSLQVDSLWQSGRYQYILQFTNKANADTWKRLASMLKASDPYSIENTLFICKGDQQEVLKKVAKGCTPIVMGDILNDETDITECDIKDLGRRRVGNYRFEITRR